MAETDALKKGIRELFGCTLPVKQSDIFVGRMAHAKETLKSIKHKIIVVGGKGGVGKTLLAANFATALAMLGRKVAILDQVFDGPCIPRMLRPCASRLMRRKKSNPSRPKNYRLGSAGEPCFPR